MNTPHIHAVELHAFAEGNKIQGFYSGHWTDDPHPHFQLDRLYRVHPGKWWKEKDAQEAGKTIQYRWSHTDHENKWHDEFKDMVFCDDHYEYRVKPDTIRFRLFKQQQVHGVSVETTVHNLEHTLYFRGWVGDWQEVEI